MLHLHAAVVAAEVVLSCLGFHTQTIVDEPKRAVCDVVVVWCRPAKYSFSLHEINSAALALVERTSINNIDHLFHQ